MAQSGFQVGRDTRPFTFIASAEVIQLSGITPVFVDLAPQTFNMDPEAWREAIAGLGKVPATAPLGASSGGQFCPPIFLNFLESSRDR